MAYEYANFPDGFSPGVVIKEVLGADFIPGKIWWVGNNATLLKGESAAADSSHLQSGTFFKPFSTIDHAYNQCKANRNDVIMVRPNHTLSIANATTLVMDVAGVHIIGLGSGENRPIITFATATAAAIPVTGANNTLANMVFKCNIASQNHMIDVAADDFKVLNCEFREGTATGLTFITADTADGDSDRLLIKNCKFHMPTAGNGDAAITLAKDFTGVVVENCDIYGDFDNAAFEIPAGGNAQINLVVKDCNITNLLTGVHAIEINGTSSTGKIINCYCQGDTLGTIVDAGGLEMYNVYEHDGTDQTTARLVAPLSSPILVDDANNPIGVDDANNVFASTNVVADRDGSVLERLEHILDCIVDDETTNALGVNDADNAFVSSSVVANRDGSLLERSEFLMNHVTQGLAVASVDLSAASPRTVYTITGGPILIHFLGIKITAACSANAALVNFNSVPTVGSPTVISKVACAPDLQSAAAGDWFAIGGGSAEVAIKYATGSVLPDIQSGTSGGIVVDAGTITVVMSTDNLTTGTATAYMAYTPLSSGVTVA